MAMQYGTPQAVPLQQAAVQQQLGSTMPLPTGLGVQAIWSQGHGAASGNAGVASRSADPGNGSVATPSGSAGAGSGTKRPTAEPWTSRRSERQRREILNKVDEVKNDMAKSQESVNASMLDLDTAVHRKAHCSKPHASNNTH